MVEEYEDWSPQVSFMFTHLNQDEGRRIKQIHVQHDVTNTGSLRRTMGKKRRF